VAAGLDRKLVAAVATADAAASVTGGDKMVSPPPPGAAVFGVVSVGDVLLGLLDSPRPTGPVVPKDSEPLFLPNGNPLPETFVEDLKKSRKAFVESLASLPPATLTATRAGNELRVELFQPKVQAGGLKAVIDAGANWLDKTGGLRSTNRNGGYDRQIYGRW
jgi:hypothetical protein